MSLTKKISRIKDLASLKPDNRWEKIAKFDLLDEISSQNRLRQAYKLSNTQKVDLFTMRFFNRLAPSFTKVLTTFLVLMMFFGVNIAAQASVPGEPLWPVKRSIEIVELSLTFSPVKKTEVYIKHVNERLDEIDKILEIDTEEITAQVEQESAIKQAVSHLEQDIASVDSSLQIVKEEKEAFETVELIQTVTSATKEIIIDLEAKIEATDNFIIEEALGGAKEAQVEAETAAVDLAIEVYEEILAVAVAAEAVEIIAEVGTPIVSSTPEELPSSEEIEAITIIVAEIVAEQIEDLAIEIDTTQVEVSNVVAEELVELSAAVPTEGQETDVVDIIEDINNITENPEAAAVILDEAKVLLEEGSFKDAIAKVSESKELNDKSEVILDKIDELQVEKPLEDPNNTEPVPGEEIPSTSVEASLPGTEIEAAMPSEGTSVEASLPNTGVASLPDDTEVIETDTPDGYIR